MTLSHILVIEDDTDLRQLLVDELSDAGYACVAAENLKAARQQLDNAKPQLVVSDLRLPDGDGMQLLNELKHLPDPPAHILITAFGSIDQAVMALKQGAADFLTKPLDLDHLRLSVARTLDARRLKQEVVNYRRWMSGGDFHGMIGQSSCMHRLFTQIQQVAQAGGPVLVTGESGTGKELVARAIHEESARSSKPFIAINCGGLPAALLESELFGHVAGAFTGATKARKGLFAAADGGTLLLDEIGELPLEMQSTLLRILQDGCVRPLGANHEHSVDVRIVAATNRDLLQEVSRGTFREDLYYRLETFTLEVPALRQRGDDLTLIATYLIDHFGKQLQRPARSINPQAMAHIKSYSFPGNVRELTNIIERAVTFCHDDCIGVEHLPARVSRVGSTTVEVENSEQWQPPTQGGELLPLEVIERDYVHHVLAQVDGNKRRAADILGIGRRTLYRWLDR